MRKTEWLGKLSGIFYAMLIAVGVTGLSFFEAFALLDEWAYDVFERLTLAQTARTKVVLVQAPPESQAHPNQTWLTLLDRLEEKQAKQVVFTFMPSGVSSDFYCQAHQYGNVFFARSVQRDGREIRLAPIPTVPVNCEIQFGVVDIPPHIHGIHRQQTALFQIKGQSYSALEMVAAEHFLGKKLLDVNTQHPPVWLQNGRYRVKFGDGLDDFPKIKLDRIITGGLVSELVKDRSVIVGLTSPSDVPGLHTPLAMTHDVMISMPEYQALALNTLLTEAHITLLNIKMEWVVLFLLMVLNLFIYQRLTIYQTLRATMMVMGFYVVVAWLFYHYTQIWLPLAEMIIAQILLYLFDFQYKSTTSDRALRETLVDSSFKIGDRVNSESFASDEYWSQIVVMSHELLNLSRTIVLELPRNQNYVNEVKALHCTVADITQRRCNKKPYSTAANKMLHLKQPLLEATEVPEEQYLVPLRFGEEVQGFWVLAIETAKPPLSFEDGVKDLAIQLGESLYHRQQWLLRHRTSQKGLNRYFRFEQGELLHKALDKSITALEYRLSVLENILDDLETPTILYDVFGTAIQVNKSMKALSHTFGLTPEKMSALGFLMEVSKIDMVTAKNYFRNILLEQGKIVQPVNLSAAIERFLVLNMHLFYYQDEVDGIELDIKKGILCQLVDVTKIKLRSTLKEQVAERLIYQFRNDMQSILMASKLLISDKAGEAEKRMVGGILESKVNNHIKILNEVEEQLRADLDATSTDSGFEVYPIDPKAPVFEVIESLAERAVERQLKLHQDLPALVSLVFAAPNELTSVIARLLAVLIDDAAPNTQITIGMKEQDNWLTYTFKNTGFGIPNERLQQYLFDSEAEVSEQFEAIRQAIEFVKAWQGTLTANSEVGQGMSFELRLRSFI